MVSAAECLAIESSLRVSYSSSPFGLGIITDNLQRRSRRIVNLYLGYKEQKEITKDFRFMVSKEDRKYIRFFNQKEMRFISVPSSSRWNSEGSYFWKMRKSFLQEVNGLRSVKMLTLTFDESHVSGHLPAWWTLGVKEYAAVYGWKYINAFLKRLREYRKKAGQRWNYLGAVMELQESGMVHFHVLFFGKWIAPIAVLKQYWDGSKHDAGVDVAKGDSVKGSVRYVTKYITKMGEAASNPDHEYINSIIWFFGVRLYNLRHVRKGPVSEAKEKPEKGLWAFDHYTYGIESPEELETLLVDRFSFVSAWFDARGQGVPDDEEKMVSE